MAPKLQGSSATWPFETELSCKALLKLSYMALELHDSLATWSYELIYVAPELPGSVAAWPSRLFCLFEQLSFKN